MDFEEGIFFIMSLIFYCVYYYKIYFVNKYSLKTFLFIFAMFTILYIAE